jgi:predicted phosphodiesterase
MKLALLTDLHANRQALEAVWAHAQEQGFDRLVLLGDYVDYGADPVWVLDFVMARVKEGALAVKGNHDDALSGGSDHAMAAHVQATLNWTDQQLSDAHRDFIRALPITLRLGDCLLTHANAHAPQDWGYIHGRLEASRSLYATDGNPAACYALFDTDTATLTFHRVPYDHDAAAASIIAAGLPADLAERLQHGL